MTVIPLEHLTLSSLRPRQHLSALWWLALLFRNPNAFTKAFHLAFNSTSKWKQVKTGLGLYLHLIPYFVFLDLLGTLLVSAFFPNSAFASAYQILSGHVFLIVAGIAAGSIVASIFNITGRKTAGIVFGTAAGIVIGIAFGISQSGAGGFAEVLAGCVVMGLIIGIAFGCAGGIGGNITFGLTAGIAIGIALSIVFGIFVGIAAGIAFTVAGRIAMGVSRGIGGILSAAIAFGISGGISFGVTLGIDIGLTEGSPYGMVNGIIGGAGSAVLNGVLSGIVASLVSQLSFFIAFAVVGAAVRITVFGIVHLLFLLGVIHYRHYSKHPAASDIFYPVPFINLDMLLVKYANIDPSVAEMEIARLIARHPAQRFNALRAKATIIARKCAKLTDLTNLPSLTSCLPEGTRGFLRETQKIVDWTHTIAREQEQLNAADRPFFKEPLARTLAAEIDRFQNRIAGFNEPLRTEFGKSAEAWSQQVEHQISDIKKITSREPTPQVFRAGDPVDRTREAFVPRLNIIGELDSLIMLNTGCPGILLHGRRRIGKSTIVKNLTGDFVSPQLEVIHLSMQDARMFSSQKSWVETVCASIQKHFELAVSFHESTGTLSGLMTCLSHCNSHLQQENRRLLIGIDEYEKMDAKIGQGIFSGDLLDTIRESIQTHRHITWMFVGSHEINRLVNAQWTSNFISLRTVEVEPFSIKETRLLLTNPLGHATILGDDISTRNEIAPSFWGENGIERIHEETCGWPNFVQLLAETMVDLVNNEETDCVNPAIFERALNKAIVRADTVLSELIYKESIAPECPNEGEWEYLQGFRTMDFQPPPKDYNILRSLKRRLMVIEKNGQCRMRVPLMQRWLRERG